MFGRAFPRRPRDGSGFPARTCQKPNPLKPPARGFGVRSDEFADWPGANCNDPLRADEMRKLDFPFEDRAGFNRKNSIELSNIKSNELLAPSTVVHGPVIASAS